MLPCQSLISIVLIAACTFQLGKAEYGRLNSYLVENVESDDIEANFAAAADWLKDASVLTPKSDLKQFLALREVLDDNECSEKSYQIMASNVKATNLLQLTEVIRRVDRIVKIVFLKQAQVCEGVYADKFRLKQAVDDEQARKAQIVARDFMTKTLFSNMDNYYQPGSGILYERFVRPNLAVNQLYGRQKVPRSALKEILEGQPDEKYLYMVPDQKTGKKYVDKQKLDRLVDEHLIAPCRYFVDKFGQEVFNQAELYKLAFKRNQSDRDFYEGWSCFKICGLFVNKTHKSSLVNDLIKAIEDPLDAKYN